MIRAIATGVLSLFVLAAPVSADFLITHDGHMLQGEVLERDGDTVVFRYQIAGVWTSRTFTKRDYSKIREEPGNQCDIGDEPVEGSDGASSNEPFIAVIPLKGAVGPLESQYFIADGLRAGLDRAAHDGASCVVLRIDSPGGLVDEMELICDLLLERQKDMRIVAWPEDALSAAAIITLCCKEVLVMPDSRIGAAVIVQNTGQGLDAVEAKMASPHHARQRIFMERSGHPYEVVAAMTIQNKSLWRSRASGKFTNDPQVAASGDWYLVDDEQTVLTMTADDAVAWGIASDEIEHERELARILDLDDETPVRGLGSVLASVNKRYEKRFDRLVDEINAYFRSLVGVHDALTIYANSVEQDDPVAQKAALRKCADSTRRASAARKKIAAYERFFLGARFERPGEIVDQMERDEKSLSSLMRNLRQGKLDGFDRAVDEFNAMVEAWDALLD